MESRRGTYRLSSKYWTLINTNFVPETFYVLFKYTVQSVEKNTSQIFDCEKPCKINSDLTSYDDTATEQTSLIFFVELIVKVYFLSDIKKLFWFLCFK